MKKLFLLAFLLCANMIFAQTSEYCDYLFDPVPNNNNAVAGAEDAALFTWETLSNGKIKITIAPADEINYPDVAFRNNGINTIANVRVDGVGDKFTLSINTAKTEITLTPKAPIAIGSTVSYTGTLEYRTTGNVADGMNLEDLYPAAPFTAYSYGYDCTGVVDLFSLAVPQNVAMNGNVVTFDAVSNATGYKAYIYYNTTELLTQNISASGATLNFPFSGNFSVKVQALDNTGIYANSEPSDAATWTITIPDGIVGNSAYCRDLFNPAGGSGNGVATDEDAAWFTVITNDEGNIEFTIEGYGINAATTAFRTNGININNLTIGGIAAANIVVKTQDGSTKQIFAPKAGISIPKGTVIIYNGYIQYRVLPAGSPGELDNLYPSRTFNFTYGESCPAPEDAVATTIKIIPENVVMYVAQPEEVKVLSLNNSLIDYHDQYLVFGSLATSGGKKATWTKETQLGQPLSYHYTLASSKNAVSSESWTHIVLQEHSNKPITDFDGFLASVKDWVTYIRENCPNPRAKIILPVNWAYTDAADFSGDNALLFANYQKAAQEAGVFIAPVGTAYQLIYDTDGAAAKNALYSDNRHPTVAATYLAACVEYAAIFNETPVGLTYFPAGISQAEATTMQNHAWTAYRNYLPNAVVNDFDGTVNYVYQILDQYNTLMTKDLPVVTLASTGGTFSGNKLTVTPAAGNYTISATAVSPAIVGTTSLKIAEYEESQVPPEEDYFVSLVPNTTYSQDFDGIGTTATATLPEGWKMEKMFVVRQVGTWDAAVKQTEYAGGTLLSASATNGLWNFGATADNTDRAIGGISAGTANNQTHCSNFYVKVKNISSVGIDDFTLSYDVEKYRTGTQPGGFRMQMYYSTDGQNWTSAGSDFETFFPADGTTLGCDNAPCTTVSVAQTLDQSLAAGNSLYLAWNYSVASSTSWNAAQVLALDNVSILGNSSGTTDLPENILNDKIVDIQYFTIAGVKIKQPDARGFYIQRTIFDSGKAIAEKIFKK